MKNDSNSFSTLKKDSKSFSINTDNFTYDEYLNLINCDIPEDFFKIIAEENDFNIEDGDMVIMNIEWLERYKHFDFIRFTEFVSHDIIIFVKRVANKIVKNIFFISITLFFLLKSVYY